MATTEPELISPEFTIHDRLRKAREVAGLTQDELADAIEVSPRTVTRYESVAVHALRTIVLRQWALRCGVPHAWLTQGISGRTWNRVSAGQLRFLNAA